MTNDVWTCPNAPETLGVGTVTALLTFERRHGDWASRTSTDALGLASLNRRALVESVRASSCIEGIRYPSEDVARMLFEDTPASWRYPDQWAIKGLGAIYQKIYREADDLPLTEALLFELHETLYRFSPDTVAHAGHYKSRENAVVSHAPDGTLTLLLETVPASTTPQAVRALIDWTNQALSSPVFISPVIVIGMFVASFLAIHPFEDGNGRLSRALSTLLLLRAGYDLFRYQSIESLIERDVEHYYASLRLTQKTLTKASPMWEPWMQFWASALSRTAGAAEKQRLAQTSTEPLSQGAVAIMKLLEAHTSLSVSAVARLTGTNKFTVRDQLYSLWRAGFLVRRGKGRATTYALNTWKG